MKISKRVKSVIIALVLVLSAAGAVACSGSKNPDTRTETGTKEKTDEKTETEARKEAETNTEKETDHPTEKPEEKESEKETEKETEKDSEAPSESATEKDHEPTESAPCCFIFDFEENDCGFIPIFADYDDIENAKEFYEFDAEHSALPDSLNGKGLYLSGNNHSDDCFMGYYKRMSGFEPGKEYTFNISFKIATNVEEGEIGVGGAPGEGVTVKCGIVPVEPVADVKEKSEVTPGIFRMNIDTGDQANSGKDMQAVGNLAKQTSAKPGEYEFNSYELSVTVKANEKGDLWLIIATDSGYEATSSIYIDDIKVGW